MERKNTKMKHSALSSNYEDVGLLAYSVPG